MSDVDSEPEDNRDIIEEIEEVNEPDVSHQSDTQENDGNEADGEGNDEGNADTRQEVKPKKVVRNPQPKLNSERLKGPRGIQTLEKFFQNVKFKGPGHEQEDLNTLMKHYEYWCHRLFPKLPFDDCLEKLETLGYKKPVQTFIKKIRMNLVDDEIIPSSNDIIEEDDDDDDKVNTGFDSLLNTQTQPTINMVQPDALTAEQLERIRINKEKAARLKLERLKKAQEKAQNNLSVSSFLNHTSQEETLENIDETSNNENREYSDAQHSNDNTTEQEDISRNSSQSSNIITQPDDNISQPSSVVKKQLESDDQHSENDDEQSENIEKKTVSSQKKKRFIIDSDSDSMDVPEEYENAENTKKSSQNNSDVAISDVDSNSPSTLIKNSNEADDTSENIEGDFALGEKPAVSKKKKKYVFDSDNDSTEENTNDHNSSSDKLEANISQPSSVSVEEQKKDDEISEERNSELGSDTPTDGTSKIDTKNVKDIVNNSDSDSMDIPEEYVKQNDDDRAYDSDYSEVV